MHAPRSVEGRQVWDLAMRGGGQMRLIRRPVEGGECISVTGWDMAAMLALAAASGVPAQWAAEFLPEIEVAMVRAVNGGGDG